MSQITSGFRSILSNPFIYNLMQRFMGADRSRRYFTEKIIRAKAGDRILDLGCGTAEILDYLPDVDYHGYDISQQYIDSASARFKAKGTFSAEILTAEAAEKIPKFDIVLSIGVLHHLNDRDAVELFKTAHAALKPGGRLLAIDPVYESGQNPVARFLISKDRGMNVRDKQGYLDLIPDNLFNVDSFVKSQAWIPYTHFYIIAEKSNS